MTAMPPGGRTTRSPFVIGLIAAGGALVMVTAFLALYRLATVIVMLVAATFLAIGLDRPTAALTRRGLRRGTAIAILAATTLILLILGLWLVVPPLTHQAEQFFAELPDRLARFNGSKTGEDAGDRLSDLITPSTTGRLATGLVSGAASLAGFLFLLVTTALLTLFLLAGLPRVRDAAYRYVPATRRPGVRALGERVVSIIGSYLVGAIAVAFFAAVAAFLWCLAAGVPYPLLMALVVGAFDLIPQIGATIGSTVVILVALSQSFTTALLTLLFFLAYQGLENWIVYPRVMSRAVSITNLAAIVAALIGGALFGVFGVLIAVPTYASIQLIVREVVFTRQDGR
jgi:predicted PurR-regulated permease PerM